MAIGRTKSEIEYRRLLAAHARSGKTLKEFAEERGLPPHRFSWWKREIRRRDATDQGDARCERAEPKTRIASEPTPRFLPVRVVEAVAVSTAAARAVSSDGDYELEFGGRRLRLPRDFDPARAGALVRAVEGSC